MPRRYRPEIVISVLLGIAATFGLMSVVRAGDRVDAAAHDHAEHVLWPAFVSKTNEWLFNHPMSDPKHLQLLDVADLKRFRAARQAWKEFDEEMKRAGY